MLKQCRKFISHECQLPEFFRKMKLNLNIVQNNPSYGFNFGERLIQTYLILFQFGFTECR